MPAAVGASDVTSVRGLSILAYICQSLDEVGGARPRAPRCSEIGLVGPNSRSPVKLTRSWNLPRVC